MVYFSPPAPDRGSRMWAGDPGGSRMWAGDPGRFEHHRVSSPSSHYHPPTCRCFISLLESDPPGPHGSNPPLYPSWTPKNSVTSFIIFIQSPLEKIGPAFELTMSSTLRALENRGQKEARWFAWQLNATRHGGYFYF